MFRKAILFSIAVFASGMFAHSAHALSCSRSSLEDTAKEYPSAFIGTVIKTVDVTPVPARNFLGVHQIEFTYKVEKSWGSKRPDEQTVIRDVDTLFDSGVVHEKGRRIIFLKDTQSAKPHLSVCNPRFWPQNEPNYEEILDKAYAQEISK